MFMNAPKANVRFAQAGDIAGMIDLSYAKRRADEKVQPQFWRYKAGAEVVQEEWFQQLLHQENYLLSKNIAQIVAVSGAHDESKRQFLKQAGLSVASEWYVGAL